ncbi:hypothetical protein [Arthrobacter tecti]
MVGNVRDKSTTTASPPIATTLGPPSAGLKTRPASMPEVPSSRRISLALEMVVADGTSQSG